MRGLTSARHVRQARFGHLREGDRFKVGREEFIFVALVRDAVTDRAWVEATTPDGAKKRNFNPEVIAARAKAKTAEVALAPVAVVKAAPGEGKVRSRKVRGTVIPPGEFVTEHPADWPTPSETTWRNRCRCEACCEAKREMNRRYRARGREAAYRQRKKIKARAARATTG